jgi:hypothetical protein
MQKLVKEVGFKGYIGIKYDDPRILPICSVVN